MQKKLAKDHLFFIKKIRATNAHKMMRLQFVAACFLFFISLCFVALVVLFLFEKKFNARIYPGIMLGESNVSGFTRSDVEKHIRDFRRELETEGIAFIYKSQSVQMFPQIIAPEDLDLTYELIGVDIEKTINNLFAIGRDGTFIENVKTKIQLMMNTRLVPYAAVLSKQNILQALHQNFKMLEYPAKDAKISIDDHLRVTIISEEQGTIPDYGSAIQKLETQLQRGSRDGIILNTKKDVPQITEALLRSKQEEISMLFSKNRALALAFEETKWEIPPLLYKDWLDTQENSLQFSEKLTEYVQKELSASIEREAEEPRFQLGEGDKVTEFKPSREGRGINYEKTFVAVNAYFFQKDATSSPVQIVTETLLPKYTTEGINNLGIKEIIGVGKSNFSGSPQNRRHNIKVGADTLNGILIAPGEEFSLVEALGEISGKSGYLPELVIKGNRTIPEFGGGLCQIGTTLFRAALASGLDITERRSHSYRVRYYEPAGTDCTIYSPHPDCRFKNDTGHHILIQTYMTEKDDLVFEFWGTKDGRTVTMTDPIIYNVTAPPPTKYIETEDLMPGETKCTERAHTGAETKFDYTVSYNDGATKSRTFQSYYRPWRAICLIGKKNEEAPTGGGEASPPSSASEEPASVPLTP